MKINPAKALFFMTLAVPIIFLFFSIKDPVEGLERAGKPLKIVLSGGEKPWLLKYFYQTRTLKVIKPSRKIRLQGSELQKSFSVIKDYLNEPAERDEVFFIKLSTGTEEAFQTFTSFAQDWKKNPLSLKLLFQNLWEINDKELSNFSNWQLFNLSIEVLHLNPSDFVIEEFEIKKNPEEEDGTETVSDGVSIKTEVFNASGKSNLAVKTAKYLRSKKIDVINFSTLKTQPKSEIITQDDSKEKMDKAKKVRELLGLQGLEIHVKKSKYKIADLTIIIGMDFDEKKVGNE